MKWMNNISKMADESEHINPNKFNPDLAVKPDDWNKPLCRNCEHLQYCPEDGHYCENEGGLTNEPIDEFCCEMFKQRYR